MRLFTAKVFVSIWAMSLVSRLATYSHLLFGLTNKPAGASPTLTSFVEWLTPVLMASTRLSNHSAAYRVLLSGEKANPTGEPWIFMVSTTLLVLASMTLIS